VLVEKLSKDISESHLQLLIAMQIKFGKIVSFIIKKSNKLNELILGFKNSSQIISGLFLLLLKDYAFYSKDLSEKTSIADALLESAFSSLYSV
jgi:hypothetical protein